MGRGRAVGLLVLAGMVTRLGIYVGLAEKGWFYGVPWDTFSRTHLAWQWAQRPYFAAGDLYWLPLQFWFVGVAYVLLRPLTGNASDLLVPVAVNNLFAAGSLALTALTAAELGGLPAAILACLLAATFAPDVWVSYSGLAEPIYIFFILLAGRLMLRHWRSPAFPVAVGGVGLAAGAVHYIGWFVGAFCAVAVGVRTALCPQARRGRDLALSLGGLLLCGLFPALWLAANWRAWGDPFHFVKVAAAYQAPYAGKLGLGERLLAPARTALEVLGPLAPVGAAGVLGVLTRRPGAVRYLLPGLWVLGLVWLAAASGLAATFQEPRYLTFVGWLVIPFAAALLGGLWARGAAGRAAAALAAGLLAATGLYQTLSFSNSFGPDLAEVGRRAGAFLRENPGSRVAVEVASLEPLADYGERGVLPVVAGFPDRFDFVVEKAPEAAEVLLGRARSGDLVVTRSLATARLASASGLRVEAVGRYFLVRR
jgi:hypothetical protein